MSGTSASAGTVRTAEPGPVTPTRHDTANAPVNNSLATRSNSLEAPGAEFPLPSAQELGLAPNTVHVLEPVGLENDPLQQYVLALKAMCHADYYVCVGNQAEVESRQSPREYAQGILISGGDAAPKKEELKFWQDRSIPGHTVLLVKTNANGDPIAFLLGHLGAEGYGKADGQVKDNLHTLTSGTFMDSTEGAKIAILYKVVASTPGFRDFTELNAARQELAGEFARYAKSRGAQIAVLDTGVDLGNASGLRAPRSWGICCRTDLALVRAMASAVGATQPIIVVGDKGTREYRSDHLVATLDQGISLEPNYVEEIPEDETVPWMDTIAVSTRIFGLPN